MNKGRLVGGLIAAEIFSMAGYAAFASLLVELSHRWQLDPVQAGWISSAYMIGYVLAVPALVGLTDRIDPREIYLIGAALGVISGCGFAWLAHGFWSAMLFRALAGMALAGTYMPGLRILTERLKGAARIRSVPYYTAAFGVGASLSFFASGWTALRYGWPGAFWASALGSIVAAFLMLAAAWGIPIEREPNAVANSRHPLDFRPVLTNRDALAYVLAYGGHSWELFGFRAWLPAYLLFAWTRFSGGAPGSAITNWATVITVASLPASIMGAEFALRGSRNRLIRGFAISSVVVGLITAFCGNFSFELTVIMLFGYAFAISADSGALTAGAVAAARPGEQGATLAVYSLAGFAGGAIGPLATGFALDAGGGLRMPGAWHLAFVALVTGSALAAVAISIVSRAHPDSAFASNIAK
jgi:MFS family permease